MNDFIEKLKEIKKELLTYNFFDPAEHLYDGLKVLDRFIREQTNIKSLLDFLWGLNSPTVSDFSENKSFTKFREDATLLIETKVRELNEK